MKRLLAIFLSLTMLVSAAPLSALAASDNSLSQTITVQSQPDADLVQAIASDPFLTRVDSAPVQEQNATVDTSNVSMEATNSFGKLLLDGMDLDGENGSNFSSGNRVIGITMNGSTATVKYVAEEDADLVVGIYADDAEEQMVASGTVATQKTLENTGYSTVDIEVTGSIPTYYVVKAYLLDKTEHAPLSNAYTDRSATKVIVDLESATINDFPEEQVVNLDDKSTTNFIVVNDNVTLLKADEVTVGKNQVVEIDNENLTYVIGNATEEIKSLQIGDVLTYEYEPGYFLIARVADISVDGDMVTIHGDNTLEEGDVFEAIKIETDASGDDFVCDDSALDEGVQYAGLEAMDEDDTEALEETNDIKNRIGHKFELLGGKSPVNGTVKISIGATAKYAYANGQKNVSFTFDSEVDVTLAIKGKIDGKLLSVPLGFQPFPGCYIGFEPTVKIKVELTGSIGAKMTSADGFEYKTFEGFQRINEAPVIKPKEFKVEATVFISIDFKPKAAFLNVEVGDEEHALVGVEINAEVGIEFKGTIYEKEKTDDVIHSCKICIPIKIAFKAQLGVKIGAFWLFNQTKTFNEWTIDLGEAYYSHDHREFGWGECPYKAYKVKVSLEKCTEPDILIQERTVDGKLTDIGKTGEDGTLETYLQPGGYTFVAATQTLRYSETFAVSKSASKVELKCIGTVDSGTTDPGTTDPDQPETPDPDKPDPDNPDPDTPGESEPDYVLENGVLTINSEKIMMEYTSAEETPWYEFRDSIRQIVVKSGVQKISPYAFAGCANVTNVIFEGTLTEIAAAAFEGCQDLELVDYGGTQESWNSVVIGEKNEPLYTAIIQCRDGNITPSEAEMKSGTCGDNLKWTLNYQGVLTITGYGRMTNYQWGTSPWYGDKVKRVILKAEGGTGSIDSIGDYAFAGCDKLTSINIPNRVRIAYHMLDGCSSLETIVIPDEVTGIESGAFNNCTSLKTVGLPTTMEYINSGAFAGCTSLESITLPTGIRVIESNVFSGCTSLKTVVIPSDIQEVRKNAFLNCSSLKELDFQNGLTAIKDGAFSGCESLTKITLPESVTSIGQDAFYNCKSLESITLPKKIAEISRGMFCDCVKLKSVTIPQSVTSIGHYTFYGCENLNEVHFEGTQEQWNAITRGNANDALKNATIHCTDGDIVPTAENSITTGKTTTDNTTLHAVFNGLTAGEDYAVIVSKSAENPLDAANLIYINQKTAGANGVLDVPFVSSESGAAYVVACRKGDSTNPGGNTGKDDSSTSKPGGDKSDTTKPSTPEQPSPSGGGGGAIVAVVLIGGAVAAVTAGVILMMPVEVSGVAQLGDGNVLANANVQLMKDGQQVAQTTTDESGHFALEVKRGEYELRVTTVNPETGEQTVRTASVKAPAKNTNFVF